ncbi:MAG: GNAT family N-acetyltransferase [Pontibacterium sp.]
MINQEQPKTGRIIAANTDHLAFIKRCWEQLDNDSARAFGGLSSTAAQHRSLVINTLIESDNAGLWVALSDTGQPIGTIACHAYERPHVNLPKAGVIHGLWVAPSARKQGIGRQLVNHAQAFAANKSINTLQVAWHPSNIEAALFWQSLQAEAYEVTATIKV